MAAEFAANAKDAEVVLPSLPLPVRLGEILDYIENNPAKQICRGGFTIDVAKKALKLGGKTLAITEKEAAILQYLAAAGKTVSRDDMLKTIWGYASSADTKTVENHIYRLRGKIENAFGKEIIITDGGGYKLIEN